MSATSGSYRRPASPCTRCPTHPTWACSAAPRNSTWASSSNSDTNARCHCPSGVCTPSSNPSVPWPSQVMDRTTRAVRDASSSSYPTCEHTTSHLPMVYTVSPVGVCSHMRAVGLEPTRASLMKPYGPLDSTSSTSTIPPRPRGGGPVAPPDKGGVRGDRAVVLRRRHVVPLGAWLRRYPVPRGAPTRRAPSLGRIPSGRRIPWPRSATRV